MLLAIQATRNIFCFYSVKQMHCYGNCAHLTLKTKKKMLSETTTLEIDLR